MILVAVCLPVIIGFMWYRCVGCNGDGRESFGDKHEWSVLEVTVAGARKTAICAPEFTEEEGYRVVCLTGVTGGRVWVMLNPKSAPYYKQMPQSDYILTRKQFDLVVRVGHPISTVVECMSSHLQAP